MNIFQIVEQAKIVRNNTDLANAFTAREWLIIVNHFVTARNGSLGPSKGIINVRMSRFNRALGKDMPADTETQASWNAKAADYNMSISRTRVTWQEIYNHLAQGLVNADGALPEGWATEDAASLNGDPRKTEGELNAKLSNAVGNGPWKLNNDSFEDTGIPELIAELRDLTAEFTGEKAAFIKWLDTIAGGVYHQARFKKTMQELFRDNAPANGEVTKPAVVKAAHNWFLLADDAYKTYKKTKGAAE